MTLRNWVLVCAALVLAAAPLAAQISALEGFVKGKDGKPVAGATILMTRLDAARKYQVKTDKKGYFYYSGLPLGFYSITVQVDGKDVVGVTGIRSQPGDPLLINFDLRVSPQEQESIVRQQLKKSGAEWSYLKIIPIAPSTSPQPASPASATAPAPAPETTREMTAEQKAALDKATAERLSQIKARDDLNHLFTAGLNALQAKQYSNAVELLSKASGLAPKEASIWADLGAAYAGFAATKSGPEFEAAMQQSFDAFAKAAELAPNDASTHYSYAVALAKDRKINEMWVEAKKCAGLEPANAHRTYFNLGSLLTNAGQTAVAEEAFRLAMEAAPGEPQNAEAYYQYAVTLVSKAQIGADGKVTPAPGTVEALQKYLQLAPNGPNSQAARDLLGSMGSLVETKFTDPNAAKKKKK